MCKNEAYRELFTKTEAKVIIPAAKNLILITEKYDEAVCFLENLEDTSYNFVEVDRPETKLAIACAERTVDALIAERAQMESNFRHLLEKHMDKTLAFQRENLGFTIYVDAEAACKVIREIEKLSDSNEFYTPEAKETDIIIDAIVTGFIHGDCCPAIFFDRYEYDDDDNQLLDAKTVEEAIASVEQYLEDLKEKAEELRKEEAKNKEK